MAEGFHPSIDPDDLTPATDVTTLSRHVASGPHPRRHRWLTVPSGWLLLACLLMPALEGCNEPIYPIMLPPLYSPYVLGMVVALAAASRTRACSNWGYALFALVWVTLVGWGIVAISAVVDDGLDRTGVLLGGCSLVLLLSASTRVSEQAIARTSLLSSACAVALFGAVTFDPDALWGVHVSLVAAIGLTIGSAWWCIESAPR